MYEFYFHVQLKGLNGYRDLLDKTGKVSKTIKKDISGFSVRRIKQTQNKQANNTKFLPINNR